MTKQKAQIKLFINFLLNCLKSPKNISDAVIIPVDMALAWSRGLCGHACHRRLEPAVVVTATTKSQG